MRVNVRAVILRHGKVVVSRERRQGVEHVLLPGGRVRDGESTHEALIREVAEETGLTIVAERLLYIAEVSGMYGVHNLVLVWGARPQDPERLIDYDVLVTLDSPVAQSIMPPITEQIDADPRNGWAHHPRWLGNVRQPARG